MLGYLLYSSGNVKWQLRLNDLSRADKINPLHHLRSQYNSQNFTKLKISEKMVQTVSTSK